MAERKPSAVWIVASIVILAVFLSAYVVGYFRLAKIEEVYMAAGRIARNPVPGDDLVGVYRNYEYEWIAAVYEPAGWVEAKLRGIQISVLSRPSLP